MDLESLGRAHVLRSATADVAVAREKARRRRVRRLAVVLVVVAVWLWGRLITGDPVQLGVPALPFPPEFIPGLILTLVLVVALAVPLLGAGRSPHVLFRPSEIDLGFEDVKGAGVVVEEVVKTLNLFLAHRTFKEQMGGSSRRAILFEGPPGTGKTYLAKAMAREAGVPFLFVSSSAFQSMYYGQTNRKIRSYFKALRQYARREGGAIGFIEEIDAIGAARSGMGSSTQREGISGVVNELLIQLQSFDAPPGSRRLIGWLVDQLNRWLPAHSQLRKPASPAANILVIGATNRAADLDPALLRPGRFDRSIHFDLPSRGGRREIIDYYLAKKAHDADFDEAPARDTLAAMTFGYSPVMIEHLLDEALVWALRRGGDRLSWDDVQQARMTEELGLKNPVPYAEQERRAIATHEAGHAVVAHLVGKGRKLEVLSIIKRGDALGLLSHSELEERYTKTRSEIEALIQIAFGGMVAEELFFGESGSGPAGDLQAATAAAAQMVGALGLGGSLISYEAAAAAPGANLVTKVLSADAGREAVEQILAAAKAEVTRMLEANRHTVEALRSALLERDELVGDEIADVIAKAEQTVIDLRPVPL
ncbi:MAG: AAA family ATPase [Actinomycetota bacterium]|nr:AAA family ATPase [Actinomycetota bacterium]MDQ3574158.1 AAA family ATPase [Actinomycetota bacterium]